MSKQPENKAQQTSNIENNDQPSSKHQKVAEPKNGAQDNTDKEMSEMEKKLQARIEELEAKKKKKGSDKGKDNNEDNNDSEIDELKDLAKVLKAIQQIKERFGFDDATLWNKIKATCNKALKRDKTPQERQEVREETAEIKQSVATLNNEKSAELTPAKESNEQSPLGKVAEHAKNAEGTKSENSSGLEAGQASNYVQATKVEPSSSAADPAAEKTAKNDQSETQAAEPTAPTPASMTPTPQQ